MNPDWHTKFRDSGARLFKFVKDNIRDETRRTLPKTNERDRRNQPEGECRTRRAEHWHGRTSEHRNCLGDAKVVCKVLVASIGIGARPATEIVQDVLQSSKCGRPVSWFMIM